MFPEVIPNQVGGEEVAALHGGTFEKLGPADGKLIFRAARSGKADVDAAVSAALVAQPGWAATPAVQRGLVLHKIVVALGQRREEIARIVAVETGKSYKDAIGEVGAAIQCGLFFASEGQRLYGRTTTSGVENKYAMTVRMPIGVAGLIIAANTPIANVAWKIFPALICGNSAVLKAAEDTPATAWIVGQVATEMGLPPGVLNIIQGIGSEAGSALVEHPDVGVVSFTGSTKVGREIQRIAGERFCRVSLELGGKNALVVCDDADLENAAKWVLLAAFSNAGQRCASASRVIVFESIYEQFRDLLIRRISALKIGPSDDDDFGPVINERQLNNMLSAVRASGARVLAGGSRLDGPTHRGGFYMAPTLLEDVSADAAISRQELFGPITILYRVPDYKAAIALANDSEYGLTASIHTRSIHRAMRFCDEVQAGVAVVNGGTHGSEPHMPFGGLRQSGNGTREPGTEAIDVYTELKDIYINIDPAKL